MNGFNSNWQNPASSWQQSYQPPMSTNVSMVTGLEEALYKSNAKNTESIHFHQSLPEFYRIRVDNFGQKTWQTFTYESPKANNDTPVTRADFDALVQRIERLENKEVAPNVESNG